MKNILSYYYQIIIDEQDINNQYFSYNNHHFLLEEYRRNLNEIDNLYLLNQELLKKNIKINEIILNILGKPITYYNNKYYILIKINDDKKTNNYSFLEYSNTNMDNLKRNNWAYLWEKKIDYIEYQIKHFNNKYPIINESINYYIGLSENAISYYKMLNLTNEKLYINHRRIHNLYDPIELIIDYKVRDISEYIKDKFINKEMNIIDIKTYLNKLNLSNMDYLLLYTRLLFPTYYFDLYDQIINDEDDEKILLPIIDMIDKYEELLYEIYLFIKNKHYHIIGIDWINNKFY